jgi:hypothetical protein
MLRFELSQPLNILNQFLIDKMKKYKITFLIAFIISLCVAEVLHADLLERDWLSPGDNALLYDSVSDLEWLDLDQNAGESYNTISALLGSGAPYEGFRYATGEEITGLFLNANIPTIGEWSTANTTPVQNLRSLWWPSAPSLILYFFTATASQDNHIAGFLNLNNYGEGAAYAAAVSYPNTASYYNLGHALVREGAPPDIPTNYILQRQVISSGGGAVTANDSSYFLKFTLGQSTPVDQKLVEAAKNGIAVNPGFWHSIGKSFIGDFDSDGDVDGKDLSIFAEFLIGNPSFADKMKFMAASFGRIGQE